MTLPDTATFLAADSGAWRESRIVRKVRARENLASAWKHIRGNGLKSRSHQVRREVSLFEHNERRELRRITEQLVDGSFRFAPQQGVRIRRPGKRPRPVVMGAVQNRIVQRAILDVLQQDQRVSPLLVTPFSYGGVAGRDRQGAIAAVQEAISRGHVYFVRSDIEGFFTRIHRPDVLELVAGAVGDRAFLDLLERATATNLANLEELEGDEDLFPTEHQGLAQGSCLSPLLGNLLLHHFDARMNGHGVVCIRYIDDFILLGESEAKTKRAFSSAQRIFGEQGLSAYDPREAPEKAEMGTTSGRIVFLGCEIERGLVRPTRAARKKLLREVNALLEEGRRGLRTLAAGAAEGRSFPETLRDLRLLVKGWGDAYAFCNDGLAMQHLDDQIGSATVSFYHSHRRLAADAGMQEQVRLLGVPRLAPGQVKAAVHEAAGRAAA